jgi:hypothetical protein
MQPKADAKPQRTGRVRGIPHGALHTAGLSRSREEAPSNTDLRPRPKRETSGQAPVHCARDAPTGGSMVAEVLLVPEPPGPP